MPNTLIHLGVQGFTSRTLVAKIDLRLVYLSCVIPDIPWIIQRAAHVLLPRIDRVELMLRCGVQSSLMFCVLFAAAFAVVARQPARAFAVLSTGSLFHLVLDIVQIKWARGAFLLAPFDWELASLDWLWPEHPLFYALSIASLAFVLTTWRRIDHSPVFLPWRPRRYTAAAGIFLAYLALPGYLSPALFERDTYFARTLSEQAERAGRPAAFDRALLQPGADGRVAMEIYSGETIQLAGILPPIDGLISVKGVFSSPHVLAVADYHLHPRHDRVWASMAGLALVTMVWLQSARRWSVTRR